MQNISLIDYFEELEKTWIKGKRKLLKLKKIYLDWWAKRLI